jgi:hypothetical protein
MDPRQHFINQLPHRPYCADDFQYGLKVRPLDMAAEHRHIQPNTRHAMSWLIFDIDRRGAAWAWEHANLPPPTITVINPKNGHAHLFYGLNTPVVTSPAGRTAPIRYAAAIQSAFALALGADLAYSGLMAKNPLHDDWRTIWVPVLYDLGELAEYIDLPKNTPPRATSGLGRNLALFDAVRQWAYKWVLDFQAKQVDSLAWRDAVVRQAEQMNTFPTPLPYSEVRAIGRSVARWTWQHFDEHTFRVIQTARGKLGGRPKTTTANGEPWQEQGISKATYYRRKKTGNLLGQT